MEVENKEPNVENAAPEGADTRRSENTERRPERTDRRPERRPFKKGGRGFFRKKVCKFCKNGLEVDYKKPDSLRRFVTERGKILPRRITGTCAKHQRMLTTEVKRSRALALLPYVSK